MRGYIAEGTRVLVEANLKLAREKKELRVNGRYLDPRLQDRRTKREVWVSTSKEEFESMDSNFA